MSYTITTQKLIDCHINAFGLELFLESLWAAWEHDGDEQPLTFIYRGVKVELSPVECPPHITRQIERRRRSRRPVCSGPPAPPAPPRS